MTEKIGFIFDFDDTILQSSEQRTIIIKTIANRRKLELTKDKIDKIKVIQEQIAKESSNIFYEMKILNAIFNALSIPFFSKLKAFPGAGIIYLKEKRNIKIYEGIEQLFEYLDSKSCEYTLATNSSTNYVARNLRNYPLLYEKIKNKVVSKDNIKNLKPDPESLLKASSLLGIEPRNCVVVGDLATDVAAGKAIGAITVAVASGVVSKKKLAESEPDFIFDSIKDIIVNYDKIIAKVR